METKGIVLAPDFEKAILDLGFSEFTEIQEKCIPLIQQGRDVIGQAHTGSGKTAAFGFPALEKVIPGKGIQLLVLVPLTLFAIVPVYYQFWYYSTTNYYSRFLNYALKVDSKQKYFQNFNGNLNRDYQIADYIGKTTNPDDSVFVWEDSSAIYALSRRLPPLKFVAGYHIKDFATPEEITTKLLENPPKLIILLPEASNYLDLYPLLSKNYLLINEISGSQIWRKL